MCDPISINCFPWGGAYRPRAGAQARHTGDALVFHLWCEESDPLISCRCPNGAVYLDSCLEVFLNPWPEHSDDYLNFEMNAAGALLLQKGAGRADRTALPPGLPHAPAVQAWRRGGRWGAVLHVPLAFLREVYALPAAQAVRPTGNFYQCAAPPKERYGCWARIETPCPDFHRPEFFRPIPLDQAAGDFDRIPKEEPTLCK